MIQLSESDYLAEGLARTCYFHPEDDNLCIKIGKPDVEESHLYKEINYYKKISKKDTSKFNYPFYAMYHGTIDTNFGEGFDQFITDSHGTSWLPSEQNGVIYFDETKAKFETIINF